MRVPRVLSESRAATAWIARGRVELEGDGARQTACWLMAPDRISPKSFQEALLFPMRSSPDSRTHRRSTATVALRLRTTPAGFLVSPTSWEVQS